MGNSQSSSTNKINFEDVQFALNNDYIFINTLLESEQACLIPKTIRAENEVELLNKLLKNGTKDVKIIVYGGNCNDDKIYKKYNQLTSLGFLNVYVYAGGIFEWLMLQDIYGANEFPTTKKELDILKYKPRKALNIHLLKY